MYVYIYILSRITCAFLSISSALSPSAAKVVQLLTAGVYPATVRGVVRLDT